MNDLLTLRVEKLLWRGRGLARLDSGKAVMIEPGVLPGESIAARVLADHKDYTRAESVEILAPSALRRPHPCPHAADCGGSRFGVLAPEASARIKEDMLRDTASRSLEPDVLEGSIHWASTETRQLVFDSRPDVKLDVRIELL